ncbi:hypothetical protein BVRB_8g202190 isoform B [Beta vulgaris subsp. vulgaris]|uniref:Serine-threonine/tyrosine-protein kinase catalytic domain-containing protein n=1 Tax=Beta vulgaris subsp. vulgaris TaxID=3555 RepID=A0A0J8B9L4_BETVV|nr:hypothetical protein BVRB_8g202190 isoform B [Beta vulgaris subsp. vulgaris]
MISGWSRTSSHCCCFFLVLLEVDDPTKSQKEIRADGKNKIIYVTSGYMPPEYAMEGQFSEKSDVFSFGVLLLEIISGKKNQWIDKVSLSFIGYAWKMWSEGNIIGFLDPTLGNQGSIAEKSKCIKLGLLCVQDEAQDRPNISTVISMLAAGNECLPEPKVPGYTRCHVSSHNNNTHPTGSINYLTITTTDGR